MAEVESEKTLTLAQQYSLPEKEEQSDQAEIPVEATEDKSITTSQPDQADIPMESTKDKSITTSQPDQAEIPVEVTEDKSITTSQPDQTEILVEATEEKSLTDDVVAKETNETPAAEESSEASEQEELGDQEVVETTPEIKLETAPADFRFPTTNQTRHCFTRYIEYHRCTAAKGEGAPECDKFAKYYRALCPGEWVDRWNEQRENGTFPGPL